MSPRTCRPRALLVRWLRTLAAGSLIVTACADPAREKALADLGPERDDVPAGPLHRRGQPCLVCHGGEGPARTAFATAGTISEDPAGASPATAVVVRIVDARGQEHVATTNAAGNFWFSADTPIAPPARVEVAPAADGAPRKMNAPMPSMTSCASCHGAKPSRSSAGPVHVGDSERVEEGT